MRVVSAVVVALVVAVATVGAARAAAPRIVIFSGAPLAHRVVVSDWPSIFDVVESVVPARVVRPAGLAGRPRLEVSMFWGPRWIDYLGEGKRASALTPRQADQFGVFYPAWREQPALIDLPWAGRWPRVVPPKALAILARFGVPTKLG